MNEAHDTSDSIVLIGFWAYLMTDLVLFAGLFATFAVFRGMSGGYLAINAPYVLTETIALLASSFACGLALLSARSGSVRGVLAALGATALLGALFVGMEVVEFARLAAAGSGPTHSGFLSAYFALVGTHGLHVTVGLLWMLALMVAIARRGLSHANLRKLTLLALFWHFLDIIWIFIFTIVYLMGIL